MPTIRRSALCMLVAAGCALGAAAQVPPAPPPPPAGDASNNPDVSPFVASVDRNHDGRMTHAEWTAAGAPESAFNALDQGGRGYVTKDDMDRMAAPPGIDLNGDGKVTLDEFRTFDRQHAKSPPPPRP